MTLNLAPRSLQYGSPLLVIVESLATIEFSHVFQATQVAPRRQILRKRTLQVAQSRKFSEIDTLDRDSLTEDANGAAEAAFSSPSMARAQFAMSSHKF
jgi:hypothetical protein